MFGLNKKPTIDKLGVQVSVIVSTPAFVAAQKLWNENIRIRLLDQQTGKEFLKFGYLSPKKYSVWIQRETNRPDMFELILRWEDNKTYEIYVIYQAPAGQAAVQGNDARASALLNNMLITPSVILSAQNAQT